MPVEFDTLTSLVGRPLASSQVQAVVRSLNAPMATDGDGRGYVDSRVHGVALGYEPARTLVAKPSADPETLLVASVHLYAAGVENHHQYAGRLPFGIEYGDSQAALKQKCANTDADGGGNWSSMLKKKVPAWTKFTYGDVEVHCEFGIAEGLSLVTLMVANR